MRNEQEVNLPTWSRSRCSRTHNERHCLSRNSIPETSAMPQADVEALMAGLIQTRQNKLCKIQDFRSQLRQNQRHWWILARWRSANIHWRAQRLARVVIQVYSKRDAGESQIDRSTTLGNDGREPPSRPQGDHKPSAVIRSISVVHRKRLGDSEYHGRQ